MRMLVALALQPIASGVGESYLRVTNGEAFTFIFLMIGPIKILAPFMQLTQGMDAAARRKFALRGVGYATLGALAAAALGPRMLHSWHVSVPAVILTAGVILFLVALKMVLQPYEALASPGEFQAAAVSPNRSIMPLAFPTIVTPYGVATLIALIAAASSSIETIDILGILTAVMALNLITMLFAHKLLGPIALLGFQIVGNVLTVVQVALGLQMILFGLRLANVFGSQALPQ
jgi:multiple antibiotic resistance protein